MSSAATHEAARPGLRAEGNEERTRILVVDDEAAMREMLVAALTHEGFEVFAAAGGAQALKLLENDRFDAVLTDLRMPGTSGDELVGAVRETCPDVQVVVMTGHATVEAAVSAMRRGAYDFIEKPFTTSDLASVLRRAVEAGRLRGTISLFEASRAMLGTLGQSDLVLRILQLAGRFPRIDALRLVVQAPAGGELATHAPSGATGGPDDAFVRDLSVQAIERGEPLLHPASAAHDGGENGRAGAASTLVYPLIVGDRILGALLFWRKAGQRPFSAVEHRQGSVLAAEAAMALENARLYGELREKVEELVAARLQLVQSEKLAATGRLAAGVAHEINTPTQFVGDSLQFLREGFAELLPLLASYRALRQAAADGPIDPGRLAKLARDEETADLEYLTEQIPGAIDRGLEGISRIADIVRAMKEFAHPDHNEKSAADLNRALRSTLTMARNEIKYVADVETGFGELPLVTCRIGDLNQVFLNLLVNAAHAIGDVVGTSGEKGTIGVRTRADGNRVVIEISDTGCGIPESARTKIFEPFFTTKEVGRGTGQGLAIARTIVVDRHGGTIEFESEVGRGTTFIVSLPVDGAAAP